MATQTDVTNALMALVHTAVTQYVPAITVPVKTITGWPNPPDLDPVAAGTQVVVSVIKAMDHKADFNFMGDWQRVDNTPPTPTLNVVNNTVTVFGVITLPMTCLIKVNGIPYFYAVQSTDTLGTIAQALATLIPNATATSNVITITGAYKLTARVGIKASAKRIVRFQQEGYWIDVWAHTDADRQAIATAIMIQLMTNSRVEVAPGEQAAFLTNVAKRDFDKTQKVGVNRANIYVPVDYPLTQTSSFYTITDLHTNSNVVHDIP